MNMKEMIDNLQQSKNGMQELSDEMLDAINGGGDEDYNDLVMDILNGDATYEKCMKLCLATFEMVKDYIPEIFRGSSEDACASDTPAGCGYLKNSQNQP